MVSTLLSSVPFSSCVRRSDIEGTSAALSWCTKLYECSKKVAMLAEKYVKWQLGALRLQSQSGGCSIEMWCGVIRKS